VELAAEMGHKLPGFKENVSVLKKAFQTLQVVVALLSRSCQNRSLSMVFKVSRN
jgi:hypothetical protein